jgi:hypothetical protein
MTKEAVDKLGFSDDIVVPPTSSSSSSHEEQQSGKSANKSKEETGFIAGLQVKSLPRNRNHKSGADDSAG